MIQITSGVYGDGMKRASDGPFTLSAAEEARLVARGVAKYVTSAAPVSEAPAPAADDDNKPHEGMTLKELRDIGKEYGLTFKVGMTKGDIVAAILDAQNQPEPDEDEVSEDETEEIEPDEDAPTFDATEAVL